MKSYDIAGYTYCADTFCPDCISGVVLDAYEENSSVRVALNNKTHFLANAETNLRAMATVLLGIDYDDPTSYDSDDFPKPFFVDQCDGEEFCGECHVNLSDLAVLDG